MDADFRITLGHVGFHPFAGYSGGAKLVIPGLASGETIRINHQLAKDPAATSGRIVGNPVREDLEEAFSSIAPEFAVSLILDLDHRVVGCTTGSADMSHQAAMRLHDRYYRPEIRARGDVAIVSPGGFPKDIDFRQSSKALEYAARSIKTGGSILLVAACTDGVGSADMEALWRANSCAAELATLCETTFPAGAQRVLPTARIARDFDVLIYSNLDANLARELFLSPVGTAAAVLRGWQAEHKQLVVIPSSGIEPSIR